MRRLLVGFALVLLAACRDPKPIHNPFGIRTMSTEPGGIMVLVILDENHIAAPDMPQPAGVLSVSAINAGAEPHTMACDPPRAELDAGPPMPTGDLQRMDVDLAPGRYILYCPLPGHRQRGEWAPLTVSSR